MNRMDDKKAKVLAEAIENKNTNTSLMIPVAIFFGLIALMITLEFIRK